MPPKYVFLSTPQRYSFPLLNQQIFLKAAMIGKIFNSEQSMESS